jgi:hypothetical protein
MMRQLRRLVRRATAVGCTVVAMAAVTAGTAFADDKVYETGDLAYTCAYPVIGSGALTVRWKAIGPDSLPSGGNAAIRNIEMTATIPANVADSLYNAGGVDGIRGRAATDLLVSGGTIDAGTADISIPEQFYSGSGDFPLHAASDSQPTVTAGPAPGPLTISLAPSLKMNAEFHFLNATPEWQQQDAFLCTLDSGQDPTWARITID